MPMLVLDLGTSDGSACHGSGERVVLCSLPPCGARAAGADLRDRSRHGEAEIVGIPLLEPPGCLG